MMAAREVAFIRELLLDLGLTAKAATTIYSDSKSAVEMAFDPIAFKKTKHILRAAEYLRDLVARGVVTMQHVAGAIMLADLLTKACARPIFVSLLELLDDFHASHNPSLS